MEMMEEKHTNKGKCILAELNRVCNQLFLVLPLCYTPASALALTRRCASCDVRLILR